MIHIEAKGIPGREVSQLLRAIKISGLRIVKKSIHPSN